MPSRPPLNGRNLAQYYTSSEARKRSVLREYAQPKDDQEARIIMYDPIRRILVEYFARGRDEAVIDRAVDMLKKKQVLKRGFHGHLAEIQSFGPREFA